MRSGSPNRASGTSEATSTVKVRPEARALGASKSHTLRATAPGQKRTLSNAMRPASILDMSKISSTMRNSPRVASSILRR